MAKRVVLTARLSSDIQEQKFSGGQICLILGMVGVRYRLRTKIDLNSPLVCIHPSNLHLRI